MLLVSRRKLGRCDQMGEGASEGADCVCWGGRFVWRRANKTTPLNCKEAADKFRSAVAEVEKVSHTLRLLLYEACMSVRLAGLLRCSVLICPAAQSLFQCSRSSPLSRGLLVKAESRQWKHKSTNS